MGKVRDSELRERILKALRERRYQFSGKAHSDLNLVPGLTSAGLVQELINRITSGVDVERLTHSCRSTGEAEDVYLMKFRISSTPMYVKVKFSLLEGNEQLVIFSSHVDGGAL
jgi:hypothetical protein